MYNLDLISFVRQYNSKIHKKVALLNFINDYKFYQDLYGLPNIEDVLVLFSDYPKDDEINLSNFNAEKNFNLW